MVSLKDLKKEMRNLTTDFAKPTIAMEKKLKNRSTTTQTVIELGYDGYLRLSGERMQTIKERKQQRKYERFVEKQDINYNTPYDNYNKSQLYKEMDVHELSLIVREQLEIENLYTNAALTIQLAWRRFVAVRQANNIRKALGFFQRLCLRRAIRDWNGYFEWSKKGTIGMQYVKIRNWRRAMHAVKRLRENADTKLDIKKGAAYFARMTHKHILRAWIGYYAKAKNLVRLCERAYMLRQLRKGAYTEYQIRKRAIAVIHAFVMRWKFKRLVKSLKNSYRLIGTAARRWLAKHHVMMRRVQHKLGTAHLRYGWVKFKNKLAQRMWVREVFTEIEARTIWRKKALAYEYLVERAVSRLLVKHHMATRLQRFYRQRLQARIMQDQELLARREMMALRRKAAITLQCQWRRYSAISSVNWVRGNQMRSHHLGDDIFFSLGLKNTMANMEKRDAGLINYRTLEDKLRGTKIKEIGTNVRPALHHPADIRNTNVRNRTIMIMKTRDIPLAKRMDDKPLDEELLEKNFEEPDIKDPEAERARRAVPPIDMEKLRAYKASRVQPAPGKPAFDNVAGKDPVEQSMTENKNDQRLREKRKKKRVLRNFSPMQRVYLAPLARDAQSLHLPVIRDLYSQPPGKPVDTYTVPEVLTRLELYHAVTEQMPNKNSRLYKKIEQMKEMALRAKEIEEKPRSPSRSPHARSPLARSPLMKSPLKPLKAKKKKRYPSPGISRATSPEPSYGGAVESRGTSGSHGDARPKSIGSTSKGVSLASRPNSRGDSKPPSRNGSRQPSRGSSRKGARADSPGPIRRVNTSPHMKRPVPQRPKSKEELTRWAFQVGRETQASTDENDAMNRSYPARLSKTSQGTRSRHNRSIT